MANDLINNIKDYEPYLSLSEEDIKKVKEVQEKMNEFNQVKTNFENEFIENQLTEQEVFKTTKHLTISLLSFKEKEMKEYLLNKIAQFKPKIPKGLPYFSETYFFLIFPCIIGLVLFLTFKNNSPGAMIGLGLSFATVILSEVHRKREKSAQKQYLINYDNWFNQEPSNVGDWNFFLKASVIQELLYLDYKLNNNVIDLNELDNYKTKVKLLKENHYQINLSLVRLFCNQLTSQKSIIAKYKNNEAQNIEQYENLDFNELKTILLKKSELYLNQMKISLIEQVKKLDDNNQEIFISKQKALSL